MTSKTTVMIAIEAFMENIMIAILTSKIMGCMSRVIANVIAR